MKKNLLQEFWREILLCIVVTIGSIFCKTKGSTDLKVITTDGWIEIIIFSYIVPSLFLIIHLFNLLKRQLHNPLFSINSKLLEKTGFYFSKESVITISSTFSTLLNNENKNILWELEQIELNDLEQACLTCNQIVNPQAGCSNIPKCIKKNRRIRITTIAESLIMPNSWFKKNEYYATETRLPSSIIDDDREYYINQKKTLEKYKPIKARRILIVKKDDIKNELKKYPINLTEFINSNINIEYRKNKHLEFKIIAYNKSLDNVFFNVKLNSYYDFVISKKGKQITVFAQNAKNYLTAFDSSYENNEQNAGTFYNKFQELFNQKKPTTTNNDIIVYSDVITTFEEAETFIKGLT